MLYPNFIGTSNPSQAARADNSRLVNLYLEPQDAPSGQPALYSIPGLTTFATLPEATARALYAINNRCFAVFGGSVCEVFAGGTYARYGSVPNAAAPAQIWSGVLGMNQLLIASAGNAYVLNTTTNVLSGAVLTGEAAQVGMLDGFGLALNPTTGRLRISNLLDFTTWDPTQFAERRNRPEPWSALIVNAPDIWLIGAQSGDVWYNAGTSPFPFAPRPGASFTFGTPAPASLIQLHESVYWLAQNSDGVGTVVEARGYAPQVVSSYALNAAIARYKRTTTIADAEAFGLNFSGHPLYILRFPSVPATWAFDVTTRLWSELGWWNAATNQYDLYFPRCDAHTFGRHLVGGIGSPVLAFLDLTVATEIDGTGIRRLRVPPSLDAAEHQRIVIDRFELGADAGVGWSGVVDPQVLLRTSGDFGHTWSSERRASLGKIGKYGDLIVWTRCGSSLQAWTPEVVVSDAAPWRLTGASVLGSGFGQGPGF